MIWLVKRGISVDWLFVKGSKNPEILRQKAKSLISTGQVTEAELRLRDDKTGALYSIDSNPHHGSGHQASRR